MTHRIGLLSDIHGNLTALQAVIADARTQAVTEFWFLGDLYTPGPGTQDLADLLDSVNPTLAVRGNWDDCLLETLRGEVDLDDPGSLNVARMSQYVYERIGQAGADRIAARPVAAVREVDGLRIAASHNLPTKNYGHDLLWASPQANFDRLFDGNDADVACIGHTHRQMLRYSADQRMIVNPGSVGQPFGDTPGHLAMDLRAGYAVLTLSDRRIDDVDFRKVEYDRTAEAARAEQSGLPYLELYLDYLETGRVHSHDDDLQDRISRRYGYRAEVAAFLRHLGPDRHRREPE